MKSLEFKNDGLLDSLTGVAAPAIFLESAAREFASARRDQRPLSILSLRSSHAPNALTEIDLVALARSIQKVIRKEEFFTRISESGFWIAVRGDAKAGQLLSQRIFDEFKQLDEFNQLHVHGDKNQWRASTIECTPLISFDEWIESADRIHFN
jgi:GGDEF domain-containing protein